MHTPAKRWVDLMSDNLSIKSDDQTEVKVRESLLTKKGYKIQKTRKAIRK